MAYNFTDLKKKMTEAGEWLNRELGGIRTGRATPMLLDGVTVEAYGSRMPIRDIAALGIEDARTLRITPWDLTQSKSIEKAIIVQNLGVSISTDEKGLRVHFPELTGERRVMLAKLIKEKLEHTRITLRTERDRVWGNIQKQEKDGKISEDDKFRYKEEMQKIIDETNVKLEKITDKKNEEITS
jgi:ribosome recycling factor